MWEDNTGEIVMDYRLVFLIRSVSIKLKFLNDGFVYCSFSLHKLINGLELAYLWIIVFIRCLDTHSDGTHSLQRIHWWASDVMLNSPNLFRWRLIYILDDLGILIHFQPFFFFFFFFFFVSYSCKCSTADTHKKHLVKHTTYISLCLPQPLTAAV